MPEYEDSVDSQPARVRSWEKVRVERLASNNKIMPIQQLGDAVALTRPQEDGGYYGRKATLGRLIADAELQEIVDLIAANKLTWEVEEIIKLFRAAKF